MTLNVILAGPRYSKSAGVSETVRHGLAQLKSLPGVVAAGATCCLPRAQGTHDLNFDIVAREAKFASLGEEVGWATISPGYFEALGIPVKRGRTLNERDDASAPAVVLIGERMAARFWPNRDPLGDRLIIGRGAGMREFKDEPVRQVIGVVGDIRSEGLAATPRAIMYVPQAQLPDAATAFFQRLLPIAWVVHTRGEPGRLVPAIEEQLRQATGLPVTDVAPMNRVLRAQTGRQRFSLALMVSFGGVALVLAAIGIYGLMSYTVEQQRQEIGIRLALGSDSHRVRNRVVAEGMSLTIAGVAAGLGSAWILARSIESFLYGVSARDPVVFVAAPLVLTATALLAVWLPAGRASRVNPVECLRRK